MINDVGDQATMRERVQGVGLVRISGSENFRCRAFCQVPIVEKVEMSSGQRCCSGSTLINPCTNNIVDFDASVILWRCLYAC